MLKLFMKQIISMLLLFCCVAVARGEEVGSYGVGWGLTGPYGASGLVLSSRINQKYGAKVITNFKDGIAVQSDIFTFKNKNRYWVIGAGTDSTASLIKGGAGAEWSYRKLKIHWEVALAIPFFRDTVGLEFAEFLYYFAPGLGVRYQF